MTVLLAFECRFHLEGIHTRKNSLALGLGNGQVDLIDQFICLKDCHRYTVLHHDDTVPHPLETKISHFQQSSN